MNGSIVVQKEGRSLRDTVVGGACAWLIPRWVTPNMLTGARIVLAPLFSLSLVEEWQGVAMMVFVVGALLDFVDGPLARERGIVSTSGALLDPVADKLFFLPPFVLLLWHGGKEVVPFVVVLLLLEVILTGMGVTEWIVARWSGRSCRGANAYGKVKTAIEAVIVALLLVGIVHVYLLSVLFLIAIFSAVGSIGGRVYAFTVQGKQ